MIEQKAYDLTNNENQGNTKRRKRTCFSSFGSIPKKTATCLLRDLGLFFSQLLKQFETHVYPYMLEKRWSQMSLGKEITKPKHTMGLV